MNNRFKSKAWDAENKVMQTSFGVHNESGKPFIVTGSYFEFKNWVILLCTGLKDCNGNLIFEGDVLQTELGFVGEVYWDAYEASYFIHFYKTDTQEDSHELLYSEVRLAKIIGNIYENPELLQSGMEG